MALFDQQPMGPVPARRPILIPPDPELEALVDDPVRADVQILEPVPRELAEGQAGGRRSGARRSVRWALALLLLVPSAIELVAAVAGLMFPGEAIDETVRWSARAVAGVMVVTMIVAQLWFNHRARGRTTG